MDLTGKTVGNYLIKSKLGAGGMGTVYLCEHPLIGKKVALKVLHDEMAANPSVVERFFQEAKAAADIGHDNIIDVIDFGRLQIDGKEVVYLMMEALTGESLSHRLHTKGVSIGETLQIVSTCCSALAASHAAGIVHRDIKPENIHLCVRGSNHNFVKVLDFGIAKLTHLAGSSSRTRIGAMLGTPAYMSPEQCEGKGQVDSRADIYALGVVMYELLTGRVPFLGEGYGEVLVQHMTRAPEPPSKLNPAVTPELDAIVLHAMEKDRATRFQTMDEMAAAIADPVRHYAIWSAQPHQTPFVRSGGTLVIDAPAAPGAVAATPMPQMTPTPGTPMPGLPGTPMPGLPGMTPMPGTPGTPMPGMPGMTPMPGLPGTPMPGLPGMTPMPAMAGMTPTPGMTPMPGMGMTPLPGMPGLTPVPVVGYGAPVAGRPTTLSGANAEVVAPTGVTAPAQRSRRTFIIAASAVAGLVVVGVGLGVLLGRGSSTTRSATPPMASPAAPTPSLPAPTVAPSPVQPAPSPTMPAVSPPASPAPVADADAMVATPSAPDAGAPMVQPSPTPSAKPAVSPKPTPKPRKRRPPNPDDLLKPKF
ncbi:MAG: protein kinase [Deltaproteobacteria bacterium]|nr:protein kinase [Deltaproteobacteria bacterium]